MHIVLLIGLLLGSCDLAASAPHPRDYAITKRVENVKSIVWKVNLMDLDKVPVYEVKSVPFSDDFIRGLTNRFPISGHLAPIPADVLEAPGKWICDNNGFMGRRRGIYRSDRNGIIGYFTGDDGHRWDAAARTLRVAGVPLEQEAANLAASLAQELFGFIPFRDSAKGLRYRHSFIRTRWTPKGSAEPVEVVKKREIRLYQRSPNGYEVVALGQSGACDFGFVSEAKIADFACGLIKMRERATATALSKPEVEQDLLGGSAFAFTDRVPDEIELHEVRLVYVVPEVRADIGTAWPAYQLHCRQKGEPSEATVLIYVGLKY